MNSTRCITALASLLMLLSLPSAQAQKNLEAATEPQIPLFKSITTHSPIPAYLIEGYEKSNEARVQGEALLKAGKTEAALHSFEQALTYEPNDGLVYQRLAEAYVTLGKLKEASQTFHKVLVEGFGPGIGNGAGGNAPIWAEYSLVLAKTNQSSEAMQAYNRAAYLLDYQDSQFNGGKPHLKVLLPELVEERTLPDQVRYTPEHLQALAEIIIAHEEDRFGENKETIAHLQEAVKLFPDSPVMYYYLGEILLTTDRAGSKAAYQKAAELGDDQTQAAVKAELKRVF